MTGTVDRYNVGGDQVQDVERTADFAMRSISDRLDRLEGIRGFPEIAKETFVLRDGDTRPNIDSYQLYKTANTKPTTITHFENGYPSQSIDVIIDDDYTTFDFANGNIRSVAESSWKASKKEYLHAVYDADDNLWYCQAYDLLQTVSRWQFVSFTGDRTLQLSDTFKFLRSIDSVAQTVTIPSMTDVAFQVGDQVSFYQYGSGQLTIAGDTGVIVNTPSTLTVNEQYGTVVIVCEGYDEWFIAGRMTPL